MKEESYMWYIEDSDPKDFIIPKCYVCKKPIDCIAEVPCETHLHTACFNQIKNKMKQGVSDKT